MPRINNLVPVGASDQLTASGAAVVANGQATTLLIKGLPLHLWPSNPVTLVGSKAIVLRAGS